MAEKEALKPCPKCGRAVRIKEDWHYNQHRYLIHCRCGVHVATDYAYRGEPIILTREEMATCWNEKWTNDLKVPGAKIRIIIV